MPEHRLLTCVAATLCLSGCALGKLAAMGRSHPALDAELAVAGLDGSVAIHRDALGVPHIRAQGELDAWYALGFVHAQDRLFQADLVRRVAFGGLSDWLGSPVARYDAFVRGLGIRERSEAHLAGHPEAVQAIMEAYTAGMNAGADSLTVLPIEYRLLGASFQPWQTSDCVGPVWVQSWGLAENPMVETAALALRDLAPETLDALFRIEPDTPPLDGYWETLRKIELPPWTRGFDAFDQVLGARPEASQASNNWVIGPDRSADGSPIVANDPHLSQSVPSLWYVADVAGGDLHVAGVTLPGSPFVVIGHNERIAWGLTNVMADYVDFAVLERSGDTGVVVAGEVQPLEPVDGRVDRDGETVVERVWWSDVGPLVTELDGSHVVALRWHAFEVPDQTGTLFHALNTARSVSEALEAATLPSAVAQNLVVADVDGDYAWQQFGSVPRRRAHTGRVPYPASDPEMGWDGFYEALPGEHAPERGYVVTANTRPDDPRSHGIGTWYAPPYRYDRIVERIEQAPTLDPATMAAIQRDVRDGQAAVLLDDLLAGVEPESEAARQCLDILRSWDLESDADAAGPAVWAALSRELVRSMLKDDIGAAATEVYMQAAGPGRSVLAHGWRSFLRDRPAAVDRALDAACTSLEASHGDDPEAWTWGDLHPLRLRHPFADRAPRLLKGWNMEEVPFPGSGSTVAAAGHGWRSGNRMPVGGMASMRIVMPLADLGASTLVHPGGQSGQPGSAFYASHFGPFVSGATLPLFFDDDDVTAFTLHTLTLEAR